MIKKSGLFVTIEGTEGVGKSTAIRFLQAYLAEQGVDVVVTREPGGTEIAEAIRQLILAHHNEEMTEDAELLMMFASRAQHIASIIKPALDAGKLVLCDRFTDASFAYQGAGRGISEDYIGALEKWVQKGLKPALTILLDAPASVGVARAKHRSPADRIEREKVQFFSRVRGCYLARAALDPERFRTIDASQSLSYVREALKQTMDDFLARHLSGSTDAATNDE
jgi:dTMP kinase